MRAALIASASARTDSSLGTTGLSSVAKLDVPVGTVAFRCATSPGSTSTETPPLASAVWMPIRASLGICAGWLSSSQKWLHSTNSRSGWVSWKKPVPICGLGMCDAMASTGAPLRCAS